MCFDKLKKAVGKPLKFAFNIKNIFFVFILVILSSFLNILAEINAFLSIIVFFIRIVFSIFILFSIIKLYLDFINVEKGRITTMHLKTDFKEIFVTLLSYHVLLFLFALLYVLFGVIIILLSFMIAPFVTLVVSISVICGSVLLLLILFYTNTSIIIGKNKLINAVKESINLMKNNFMYSISRIFLLGIINIVVSILAIAMPLFYVLYSKIFLLIPDDFAYMDAFAQQEYVNQLFLDFASQNAVLVLGLFLWISLIVTLFSLFNKGFVSNMYLQLTEKKDKKIKKTATKKKKEYDNKQ